MNNEFKQWTSNREIRDIISGGFFERGMRWKDYIDDYLEEDREMFESLRQEIVKNHIKITGEVMQYRGCYIAEFNNGTLISFTWRAWGDLMAAVWSEHENKDYSYMSFY